MLRSNYINVDKFQKSYNEKCSPAPRSEEERPSPSYGRVFVYS